MRMGTKFYLMGDGAKIAEAGRGAKKKDIIRLQDTFWAKKHGGICGITTLTSPHAVYYAFLEKQ